MVLRKLRCMTTVLTQVLHDLDIALISRLILHHAVIRTLNYSHAKLFALPHRCDVLSHVQTSAEDSAEMAVLCNPFFSSQKEHQPCRTVCGFWSSSFFFNTPKEFLTYYKYIINYSVLRKIYFKKINYNPNWTQILHSGLNIKRENKITWHQIWLWILYL